MRKLEISLKHVFSAFLKSSGAFVLYVAALSIVVISVAIESGAAHMPIFFWYGITVIGTYFISAGALHYFLGNASEDITSAAEAEYYDTIALSLMAGAALFIVAHFCYLGQIPIVSGALNNDYYEIMRIRQGVFMDAPALFRYIPNLLLKSLYPFLLIYLLATGHRKGFLTAVAIAVLYGAALMNKMFIIVPIAPTLLYLLYKRRFVLSAALVLFPIIILWGLVLVQNPHIRPAFWTPPGQATVSGNVMTLERNAALEKAEHRLEVGRALREENFRKRKLLAEFRRTETEMGKQAAEEFASRNNFDVDAVLNAKEYGPAHEMRDFVIQLWLTAISPFQKFIDTIYIRILLIPGQVITAWFNDIPRIIPYGEGCGYRLLSTLKECDFQFFPKLVHDLENPELAAAGIRGTMTAASFMEDYANFGEKGIIGSAMIIGIILALTGAVYRANWLWAYALNFVPIAMLMELPLTTVLLTGGWGLSVVLYAVFRKRLRAVGVAA